MFSVCLENEKTMRVNKSFFLFVTLPKKKSGILKTEKAKGRGYLCKVSRNKSLVIPAKKPKSSGAHRFSFSSVILCYSNQ